MYFLEQYQPWYRETVRLDFWLVRCTHSWAIKFNTRREIPYLNAPMFYSLFIASGAKLLNADWLRQEAFFLYNGGLLVIVTFENTREINPELPSGHTCTKQVLIPRTPCSKSVGKMENKWFWRRWILAIEVRWQFAVPKYCRLCDADVL